MKTLRTLFVALIVMAVAPMSAQNADEIINNYFENTGGMDAWNNLQGAKMIGSVNAQGMDIPIEMYQMKDGKRLVNISIQGQEMTQFSFDGETMWTTNFMTMLPEKSDAEQTANMKKNIGDFPSPFLNYKEKEYAVEYLGKETKEGTETFKIKLTQKPVMVDGKEEPLVSFFYFDTENYVPIMSETPMPIGPQKGQMSISTFSDYQEVEGLYFPFSITQSGQPIIMKEIVLNPEIDEAMFAFPAPVAEKVEVKN
jgi:outer membrane lipoprotein-sorting protein